jgi:hypothetical protein
MSRPKAAHFVCSQDPTIKLCFECGRVFHADLPDLVDRIAKHVREEHQFEFLVVCGKEFRPNSWELELRTGGEKATRSFSRRR